MVGGSGVASLAMAETFDPQALARRGVLGLEPDRAQALLWYRRAVALGAEDAAARIAILEARP
jgi:TPR repeat protein